MSTGLDFSKRLAIIVPYRDRQEHLSQYVPHVTAYLCEAAPELRYTIHIIEQLGTSPFNRGKLLNSGFNIAVNQADYFVFHDVDYLPVKADYSYVQQPTRLIWNGLVLREDYNTFFGAVTAFNRADFETVNGYPNDYWGWGFEDVDLRLRCECAGLTIAMRDGTFKALPHKHKGYIEPGRLSPEALATKRLLESRLPDFREYYPRQGLSSLATVPVWTRVLASTGSVVRVFHHGVKV